MQINRELPFIDADDMKKSNAKDSQLTSGKQTTLV